MVIATVPLEPKVWPTRCVYQHVQEAVLQVQLATPVSWLGSPAVCPGFSYLKRDATTHRFRRFRFK